MRTMLDTIDPPVSYYDELEQLSLELSVPEPQELIDADWVNGYE